MQRIDSIEDEMRDIATYEFADGTRICLSARMVREHGAEAIVRDSAYADLLPPRSARVAVTQAGRKVGTLPANFDPMFIRSSSFLYEPRRGDFVRDGDGWIAAAALGPGDLEAVVGFEEEREPAH